MNIDPLDVRDYIAVKLSRYGFSNFEWQLETDDVFRVTCRFEDKWYHATFLYDELQYPVYQTYEEPWIGHAESSARAILNASWK